MARRLAAFLLLGFAAAQAVSVTDCGCGAFCGHKNACPGHEAPADDCCDERPGQRCSHVEPQSDLLADAAAAVDLHPDALSLAIDAAPPILPTAAVDVPFERGLSPPSRGRPLYLAHHAFLI